MNTNGAEKKPATCWLDRDTDLITPEMEDVGVTYGLVGFDPAECRDAETARDVFTSMMNVVLGSRELRTRYRQLLAEPSQASS